MYIGHEGRFELVDAGSSLEKQALVHRFRKEVFYDRQGYRAADIKVIDGGEYDSVDHEGTMHIVFNKSSGIAGCLRLVRASQPHLLEKFPELSRSDDYKNEMTWDLSRLGTDGTERLGEKILCAAFELAQYRGIEQVVTFTTAERLDFLRSMGLNARQLGEKICVTGAEDVSWTAVGLGIDITEDNHRAFQNYIDDHNSFWLDLHR